MSETGKAAATHFRFLRLLVILGVFLLMTVALLAQQFHVNFASHTTDDLALIDSSTTISEGLTKASVVAVVNTQDARSAEAKVQMEGVFEQMSMQVDYLDVSQQSFSMPQDCKVVVLALSNLSELGYAISDLFDWVRAGGQLMVYIAPDPSGYLTAFQSEFGIKELSLSTYSPLGLTFTDDFMVGAQGLSFTYDDTFDSSLFLTVTDDCNVHIVSNDDQQVPLLWDRTLGAGRIVFSNIGIVEKANRGIYAQAFSLLDSSCVWPVINASAFYLDDFPSPTPAGDSAYVEEQYGVSIRDFYTNVWWPNLKKLASDYGFYYTGMIIEDYTDNTSAPFERYTDTQKFKYYASEILQTGGELGVHGYNHIPLATAGSLSDRPGFVEGSLKENYGYDYWPSQSDQAASLEELYQFSSSRFNQKEFTVYVPPSNILSTEGRQTVVDSSLGVRAIASTYLPGADNAEYDQEFEVAADGIVETPRVISGGVLDDYARLVALSELNLHYVNSHFMHPDDVLDPDRGAELGWSTLYSNITDYVSWLYTAAPGLRSVTGTQMAAAVQRWYGLSVEKTETDSEIVLNLTGLVDDGYLYLRVNDGTIDTSAVTGGEVSVLSGNLYVVHATADTVHIKKVSA